ncbi:MAG: hypothetical protein GY953_22580 [bacterium]|nr:hypothetical protein [bacterium]
MMVWRSLGLVLALSVLPLSADLEVVKAERNLEKRSRLALENADKMLDGARDAYLTGDGAKLEASFQELEESVELAYQSLRETGKKPRKNAKHYKRGEIGTRKLLRRLDTFQAEMSYLDRDKIGEVIKTVQKVHDDFLRDVMGGR